MMIYIYTLLYQEKGLTLERCFPSCKEDGHPLVWELLCCIVLDVCTLLEGKLVKLGLALAKLPSTCGIIRFSNKRLQGF